MRLAARTLALLTLPASLQAATVGVTPSGEGMDMMMPVPPAEVPSEPSPRLEPGTADAAIQALPNLAERKEWPEPITDHAKYSFILIDLLEYRESREPGVIRWDVFGWYGGDVKRVWVKSEGAQSTSARVESEQEAQLLYGQLISPFFDLQAGIRYAHRSGPGPNKSRVYAVLGLQGVAPYRYELEPALFLSQKGKVSARVTITYDLLLTQRLVLQPRLEANAALQRDRGFGIGSGLNDTEIGARLRYEIRREFAPYVGVSWKRSYGSTRRMARAEGEGTSVLSLTAGVRMWF